MNRENKSLTRNIVYQSADEVALQESIRAKGVLQQRKLALMIKILNLQLRPDAFNNHICNDPRIRSTKALRKKGGRGGSSLGLQGLITIHILVYYTKLVERSSIIDWLLLMLLLHEYIVRYFATKTRTYYPKAPKKPTRLVQFVQLRGQQLSDMFISFQIL